MISDTDLEAGLRSLRARADEMPPPPAELARLTRERYRAQRRSRAAWAAGGLVAALVFIGVPVVASTVAAEAGRSESAAPSGRSFVPSAPAGLYALPIRGPLAGDEEWLDAVTALEWGPVGDGALPPGTEAPSPPLDTRRVAFAGDVPSGRVALVLGLESRQTVYAWFTGPEGAGAAEMELATTPGTLSYGNALALVDATGPSAQTQTLVVVAEPGDRVERGLTPVVEASGDVLAERVAVPLDEGVGVVELPGRWPWSAADAGPWVVRGSGADRGVQLADSDRARSASPELRHGVDVLDPRGLAGGIDPQMTRTIAAGQLAAFGLTAEQGRPTLLAAGALGAHTGRYGELYGMTHASGATSTWLVTSWSALPDRGAEIYDQSPAKAGTALLDRVIALRAMGGVLVSAPSGVEAQLIDTSGGILGAVPLDRGAGAGPLTGLEAAASVRILDGDGDVLAETALTGVDD